MIDNFSNKLEEWIEIRELLIEDISRYLKVLTNLTEVKTDLETAKTVYERYIATNPLHYIFVANDKRSLESIQIIACCTLLVEPKLTGLADRVGHIEDVAVAKEYHGMGVGSKIVDFVTRFGFEKIKCIKIELDCSEPTRPFYALGFAYNDIMMKRINEKMD
jgi:glucosamine-phosphate N-acetyltransferase